MSEIDLDRLGDLWRAPPDPAELERIRHSAEVVRRNARLGQFTDFLLAALVSGVVVALIISNPRLETAALGGAAIVAMLISTLRQRRLRQGELKTLAGSTGQMLDQTVVRLRATVKRARFNLLGAPPAMLIGIAFGWALDRGTGSPLLTRFSASPLTSLLVGGTLILIAVASVIHFTRALRRARLELRQIARLRDDFQSETDRSADGDDRAV